MNRATSLLSFSALGHLLIIDAIFYYLSPVLAINFLIILFYNIIWLFLALIVSTNTNNDTESKHERESKNYLNQ